MSLDRVLPSYDNQTGYKHSENVGYCICFLVLDWLYSWVPCVVVNDATISSTSMWKMSQPMIMALVVITRITAAFFYVGWCSRQDGQVRISL